MKRPSFQFYPADWRNNAKLRRCSWEARGVWIEVMGLLHDSDEYGLLRWPLKQIAHGVGAPVKALSELVRNGVMKGCDSGTCEALIYTPRSGRKEGEPVTLVPAQDGPLWYSSRMVSDEHIRTVRGEGTRFGAAPLPSSKSSPKSSPKPTFGGLEGDGSTPPSSSSMKTPQPPKGARFDDFWTAWPTNERKQDKAKCLDHWKRNHLDDKADAILADIKVKLQTQKWKDGYIEAPLPYLRGKRWEDGVQPQAQGRQAGGWWETQSGIRAKGDALRVPYSAGMASGGAWLKYVARVWVAAGDGPHWDESSAIYELARSLRNGAGSGVEKLISGLSLKVAA